MPSTEQVCIGYSQVTVRLHTYTYMYLAIAINTDECVASQHLDEWAELLELQCLWPCLLAVVDGDLNTVWYRVRSGNLRHAQ